MSVEIKKVSSKKDLKIFVRFANRMYKGNPYYVPSMPFDDMGRLTRRRTVPMTFLKRSFILHTRKTNLSEGLQPS